jgi:hypothetical protein
MKIDSLVFSEFEGHVYNLETKDGFYLANGLISHNCRCQLVPKIKDDWADNALKKEGIEWDQDTGIVYNADDQERDSGIADMTLDDYLKLIPKA